MNAIWRTIRGYILWQYERGTLHYDIMVTLILIFVLFSPRVINFNDKPIARNPHPTEVVVTTDAEGHLVYQIAASAVSPETTVQCSDQLLRIIEPISGAVSIVSYDAVSDSQRKGTELQSCGEAGVDSGSPASIGFEMKDLLDHASPVILYSFSRVTRQLRTGRLLLIAAASQRKIAAENSDSLDAVLKKMDTVAASFRTTQADFEWDTYEKVIDEVDDIPDGNDLLPSQRQRHRDDGRGQEGRQRSRPS